MSSSAPWWHEYAELEHLSAEILDLLDEVEAAFATTGASTPPWEDPHLLPDGTDRDSLDEEYSRCLDPGKYRILWARVEAWTQVLTGRGWAAAHEHADGAALAWEPAPHATRHRTLVLRPHRAGAVPLVLARTAPDAAHEPGASPDAPLPGVLLGMGEPALEVELVPDCGCDACDTGSANDLEQLDRAVLSVVDGSCEVDIAPGSTGHRTSFSAGLRSGPDENPHTRRTVTAGPWAEGWRARPLAEPLTPSRRPRSRRPGPTGRIR